MSVQGPIKSISDSGLLFYYDTFNPKSYPSTSSLVDLTANCVIDISSASYDSNGNIIFTGASNKRIFSSTALFNRTTAQELSVLCWSRPTRLAGQYQDIIVNRSDAGYNWMLYQHTTDGSIQLHGSAQNKSSYIPTINQWVHLAATVNAGGTSSLYANGALQQTVNTYTYNAASPSVLSIGLFGISSEPFSGSISLAMVYNRALTSAEILQDYNSARSRFGL